MLARCSSASCSGSIATSRCARTVCGCCAAGTPEPRSTASTGAPEATRRASQPRSDRFSTTTGPSPATTTNGGNGATATSCCARWFTDRGAGLHWDSFFLAQWDLVVVSPLTELLPPSGGRGHAHLGRPSRARGRIVVAVGARRAAPRVRRLSGPRRLPVRPRRGPVVLPVHRAGGTAPVHGALRGHRRARARLPRVQDPRLRAGLSAPRSYPTPASGPGGPRSPPRPGPRAPRPSSTPGPRPSASPS